MKVLIHASGIGNFGGGMRHLTNFLPELARQDTQNEYVVILRESFPAINGHRHIRFERVPDTQAAGWAARPIGDIIELPLKLRREKFDVIVSLANFGPIWSSVPHIFFQRNALYYCDYYLSRIKGKLKLETFLRRLLAVESMKHADLIVTPSAAMADMIREACPQVKDRHFRTLYHGFHKNSLQESLDTKYQTLLARDSKKLLYPSIAMPHKGFEVLIDILTHLKSKRSDFTFFAPVSHNDWPEGVREYQKRIQTSGLTDHVVFLGHVPQSQMGALYDQCDVMIYPSLCESFGFPLIEAMGHGLPIVASGTAVNRELCGEGASYYPPEDAASGAAALGEVLKPETSRRMSARGLERINSFDWGWERYAKEFISLIGSVA